MTDLRVDYDKLETSASVADTLRDRFEGLPDRMEDRSEIWGDRDVRDAMGEFSGNWDYKRTVLVTKLGDHAKKAQSCLDAFREADDKLKRELEQKAER